MTIVVTGGGSGGHITPLLAVATEIKKQAPDTRIVYIGQRGDRFGDIVAKHAAIDESHVIFAGKFRRYHGEGWRQIFDIKTVALNVRDVFRIAAGCIQSLWLLKKIAPQKVFVKGGFVGVPVGLAAASWRIPYITHDSDALAGLANRIIARWAETHAVALPKEVYTYPQDKTVTVGVPIAPEYQKVTSKLAVAYRQKLGLAHDAQVVTVTGGGLGAQIINTAMTAIVRNLLETHPKVRIFHVAGHAHRTAVLKAYKSVVAPQDMQRIQVYDYSSELHVLTGAADVVVVRAGATNMAEMAQQGKACIVVPNPVLTGGHQLKNAKAYADKRAAVIVQEADIRRDQMVLFEAITALLDDAKAREELGAALHAFAYPDSAQQLAKILLADAMPTPVD